MCPCCPGYAAYKVRRLSSRSSLSASRRSTRSGGGVSNSATIVVVARPTSQTIGNEEHTRHFSENDKQIGSVEQPQGVLSGGDDDEGGDGYHTNPMRTAMEKTKAAVAAAAAAVAAADETVEAYHSNPMTAARQQAAAATKTAAAAAAAATSADEGVEAYHSNPMLTAKQQKAAAKAKAAAAVAAADETVDAYHSNPMTVARKASESQRASDATGAAVANTSGRRGMGRMVPHASSAIARHEDDLDSSAGGAVGVVTVAGNDRPPSDASTRIRRMRSHRSSGREEYSGDYWKTHHDGMQTHPVLRNLFGLRAIANHSTSARTWERDELNE